MVGRKTHAVHQQLPFVERTEIGRRCVAKPDDAEQFIIGGVDDRYRVRELVRRVETIFVTDRDVRRTRGSGRLAGKRRDDSGKKKRAYKANFHDQYPRGSVVAIAIVADSITDAMRTARANYAASARFLAAVPRRSPQQGGAKRDRARILIPPSPCRSRLDDEGSSLPQSRGQDHRLASRPSCPNPSGPSPALFAMQMLNSHNRSGPNSRRGDSGSALAQSR